MLVLTAILAVTAGLVTRRWLEPTLPQHQLPLAIAVAVGFAAAERWRLDVNASTRRFNHTVAEIPLLIGLFFISPLWLLIARVAGTAFGVFVLVPDMLRRSAAFNVAHKATVTLGAITVFGWVAPTGPLDGVRSLMAVLAAVTISEAITFAQLTLSATIDPNKAPRQVAVSIAAGTPLSMTIGLFGLLVCIMAASAPWALIPLAVVGLILIIGARDRTRAQAIQVALDEISVFSEATMQAVDVETVFTHLIQSIRSLLGTQTVTVLYRDNNLVQSYGDPLTIDERDSIDEVIAGVAAPLVSNLDRTPRTDLKVWHLNEATKLLVGSDPKKSAAGALWFTIDHMVRHVSLTLDAIAHQVEVHLRTQHDYQQARTDQLTQLPNGFALHEYLTDKLRSGTAVAAISVGLSGLRQISDVLGVDVGGQVLVQIAERLRSLPDTDIVARYTNEEFVVVTTTQNTSHRRFVKDPIAAAAADLAQKIEEQFETAVLGPQTPIIVNATVGYAISPESAPLSPTELLSHANLALTKSRASGRTEAFGADDAQQATRRLAIRQQLGVALDHHRLYAAFQPQINLQTGEFSGVEVLSRWHDNELGSVPPDEYIGVAERSGMIERVTYSVLEQALAIHHALRERGFQVPVAINISVASLTRPGFVSRITEMIHRHAVPISMVILELTESTVVKSDTETVDVLHQLVRRGFTLSIDDFGTGYSSLAYLHKLPIQQVKIDKSFVMPMAVDNSTHPLINGIVSICKALDLSITAEGIENRGVQRMLRQLGVDHGQGYGIGRPMVSEQFLKWVSNHRPANVRATTDTTV